MRSSAILLEVICFVTLDSVMPGPEIVCKHFLIVVLIYVSFEKGGSVDVSAGNLKLEKLPCRGGVSYSNQLVSILVIF